MGNHHLTNGIRLLLLASLVTCLTGCPKNEKPPTAPPVQVSRDVRPTGLTPLPTLFNGERAMEHARKQIDFGPRPPSTPALAKTREYIVNELKSYGFKVSFDEFLAETPEGEMKMTNIVGELTGQSKALILITSHYDTKLFKDMRFVGANDPAASVATLLEIGRVLGTRPAKLMATYRLVFFDGEEAFCENWDDCGTKENPDHLYGSRHYVETLHKRNELVDTRAMILLDMMGYKKLELGRDTMSTRWLQDLIWQTGRELGHTTIFVDRDEGVGGDDHEPFIDAGIPAVDLIQLNSYPYWHRADDTLDKISADSMKIVGDTVLASLPKIEARVLKQP